MFGKSKSKEKKVKEKNIRYHAGLPVKITIRGELIGTYVATFTTDYTEQTTTFSGPMDYFTIGDILLPVEIDPMNPKIHKVDNPIAGSEIK